MALERGRADRAVQPPPLLRGAARPPRRLRRRGGDRARRRRPLQAHQRHAGPSDRRRRAARDRTPAQGRDPPLRRDLALGRRGVLRAAGRDRRRRRARDARRAAAGIGRRLPDPGRRKRRRGGHDLDRGRATVCRMSHARAAAGQRGCGALRRQARRPQPGTYRRRRSVARARRCERGPRGRGPGAGGRCLGAWRHRPDARGAGRGPLHGRRARARAAGRDCRARAAGRMAARLRQGHRADRHPRPPRPARRPGARPHAPSRDRRRGARSVVPGLSSAAQIVRSHHERFDGMGYPDGLAGEQIPLAARIVAAADAFVAMTESRPYEGPRAHLDAIAELQSSAGGQFDPRVVDALVAVLDHERRDDRARAS